MNNIHTHTPVNNSNNVISDSVTILPDHNNHVSNYVNRYNYQQPMPNVASNNNVTNSSNHNHQQYDTLTLNNISRYNNQQSTSNGISYVNNTITPDVSNNIPQQPMLNVISNNNATISPDHNHLPYDVSSNNSHHNYQQSTSNMSNTSNNVSPSQFYPPQSNTIFPWLNSLGITINSQTTIIIMSTTNSDVQNQLILI